MSVDEFFEYWAYNQIEPFGDDREDMRAAMTPFLIFGYLAKKGKAPKYEEFLISNVIAKETKPTKSQTKSQMEKDLKALFLSTRKQ